MSVADVLDPKVDVTFGKRAGYFLFTTRALEWLREEWGVDDFGALWAKVAALRPEIEGGATFDTKDLFTSKRGIDLFAAKTLVVAAALEFCAEGLPDETEMIPKEAVQSARRTVARMLPANLLLLALQAMTAFYRAVLVPADVAAQADEDAGSRPTTETVRAAA